MNLRKAAEIMGMSHSALSKSLKVLQEDLGQILLIQAGRNIAVTDAGNRFYPKAVQFLAHESELRKREETARSKPVRIGTFEVFSTHCLGTLWGKYFDDLPLELHELLPGALEQALVSEKIDLGLTYEPIPMSGVEFTKLGEVLMEVYFRADSFKGCSFEDIPFVAPVYPIEGIPSGTRGLDGWPEDTYPRNVRYKVTMMESGLALARQGCAAIFVPRFVARLHNQSVNREHRLTAAVIKGMKPVKRAIYLVARRGSLEDGYRKKLAKLVRMECVDK